MWGLTPELSDGSQHAPRLDRGLSRRWVLVGKGGLAHGLPDRRQVGRPTARYLLDNPK